jgi:hypothetical protein
MATRERHEAPWWLLSGSGVVVVMGSILTHVLWPERMSDHALMTSLGAGGLLAGVKTAKDVTGKVLKDRRSRRDTQEHKGAS